MPAPSRATFVDHPAVYPDNDADSAPYVPRSVIIQGAFPWGADLPPRVPWDDTVIYELHVKGFTRQHPDIPPELRGTYAGLAHPAAMDYLTSLGVTAVELMPIHHFVSEPALQSRGKANYWGYNSLGFFAPHEAYAARQGNQVREFKSMVRALHAAGLEVILDVVYNHTAESGPDGPVLSFRGIDNGSYYRLAEGDPSRYVDYTGCGNTFDPRRPFPLQLITDSLRYWITEMHVDGFRFDLASALARSLHDVDKLSSFFDVIHQDPIISQTKLIAEPWDVGDGGYQVGEFPPLWTEWNGKYRDTVRTVLGARRRRRARPGLPAHRLLGPVRRRRPAAHRVDQLRHLRTTGSHCATWSATSRSTTRTTVRTTATAPTTTARTTAGSRATRRRRRSGRCGCARPATCSRPCCCPPARRCSSPATSAGAPRAATTTPTCRTTRSPGWTGPTGRRRPTCWP